MIVGVFTNDSRWKPAVLRGSREIEGADALLLFPPDILRLDGHMRPDSIIAHFKCVCDASDLPIILFQYPFASQVAYPLETLLDLCRRFPQIRAIKDQYGDGKMHERHIRELSKLDRPVNVLTTPQHVAIGLVGDGVPRRIVGSGQRDRKPAGGIVRAVQAGDLKKAQSVNDRIYPTVRAFFIRRCSICTIA